MPDWPVQFTAAIGYTLGLILVAPNLVCSQQHLRYLFGTVHKIMVPNWNVSLQERFPGGCAAQGSCFYGVHRVFRPKPHSGRSANLVLNDRRKKKFA